MQAERNNRPCELASCIVTVLYCIDSAFLAHLVLTHEYRYPIATPLWQDWCPPPNSYNPNIINHVSEDYPPFALTLLRHCCTILPKAPYPWLQQWQGLSEVEESQDTSPHSQDMPVKPPRPDGNSRLHTFQQIFFLYKYLVPGWTWTCAEEVCS